MAKQNEDGQGFLDENAAAAPRLSARGGNRKTFTERAADGLKPAEKPKYQTPEKHRAVFPDKDKMKEELRKNMHKPRYDVTCFYKDTGFCQDIARNQVFENITLSVIAFNALWISIDTDMNNAATLADADAIFVLAENLFLIYFLFEWTMRFGAFKNKQNCMKDAWFVFDSFMVFMMIMETWVLFIIMKLSSDGGNPLGNAGILRLLRLLRLSRMARMARLLRSMPELLILIKGMAAAIRSVFFTLLLLMLLLYVFAIFFRQMTAEIPELGGFYFYSIAKSLHTLLTYGVFLDNLGNIIETLDGGGHYVLLMMFYLFVLLASLTVMNMLIGVLCEVIAAVAETEMEEIQIGEVKDQLEEIVKKNLLKPDETWSEVSFTIDKLQFMELFKFTETGRLLAEIEVDLNIMDNVDTIFANEDGTDRELTFGDLVEVMLDQRASNTATVKDLTDMRKYIRARMDILQDLVDKEKEDKELTSIRLEAQLSVLGQMVEKVAGMPQGSFKQKSKEARQSAIQKLKDDEAKREAAKRKELDDKKAMEAKANQIKANLMIKTESLNVKGKVSEAAIEELQRAIKEAEIAGVPEPIVQSSKSKLQEYKAAKSGTGKGGAKDTE